MTRSVVSPAVGTVLAVLVTAGEVVREGQELVVVESMKIEIPVAAPGAGRVVAVVVEEGRHVQAGEVLVTLAAGTSA